MAYCSCRIAAQDRELGIAAQEPPPPNRGPQPSDPSYVEVKEEVVDWSNIKTQFVRDRMKETKWEDRQYIGALMTLEERVEQGMLGKSPGWAAAMLQGRRAAEYPVEYACIEREMTEGITTSYDEFINMLVKRDREAKRREEEFDRVERLNQLELARRERESERQWRQMKGEE